MSPVTQEERIAAGQHFGIHKWSHLRHAALRLVMMHTERHKEYWDENYLAKMCRRWRIGSAFAFFATHPEFWRPTA
jgi:hypothetical protein